MQKSTEAMKRAAHAPQVKPKAYLPMDASRPSCLNASRALTKVALSVTLVSLLLRVKTWTEDLRHERCGNAVEEQCDERGEPRNGRAEAAAAGEEAREECGDHEEERDQVENPAKAPHIEVVL